MKSSRQCSWNENCKKNGYEVVPHVSTGEAAIQSVKCNQPDIVLMDIRLAGKMDGIEAASAIKSESDIPIIFITGYDDQSVRLRAIQVQPLDYLCKPFTMNELTTIIDAYFQQAS